MELSEILELSQSNTSHHVKALRDLGLLTAEKIGQHTYYGLNSETTGAPRVTALLKNLSDLGDELAETRSDATRLLRPRHRGKGHDRRLSFRLPECRNADQRRQRLCLCGREGLIADRSDRGRRGQRGALFLSCRLRDLPGNSELKKLPATAC